MKKEKNMKKYNLWKYLKKLNKISQVDLDNIEQMFKTILEKDSKIVGDKTFNIKEHLSGKTHFDISGKIKDVDGIYHKLEIKGIQMLSLNIGKVFLTQLIYNKTPVYVNDITVNDISVIQNFKSVKKALV